MRTLPTPYSHILSLLTLLFGMAQVGMARQAPPVAVDDPLHAFMGTLLLEGMAPNVPALSWPKPASELAAWLRDVPTESIWAAGTAERMLARLPETSRPGRLHADLRSGIRLASQDRRDLLRYQAMDDVSWQPMLLARSWIQEGAWTASIGVRVDRWYEIDPDGMDTAHRWLSRAEDAYVARDGRFVDVFFGRMGRHWGSIDGPGLLLSRNPRPMDQIAWRMGPDRVYVESVLAELDSFTGDGRMTGTAGADSVRAGSNRRMLAAHRLVVRMSPAWTVGLSHATLYSGPGSGFSLKFANPFNVALWEVDNRPKNDENNGMVGAFFSYRGKRSMANGELILDDVDVLNGKEPASLAAHLAFSHRIMPRRVSLGLSATVVTARAYNSEQAEGRWLYLGRGIAMQHSDVAHLTGHMDWLRFPGWLVRTGIDLLRQGEADFREELPSLDEKVLFTGTSRTTLRPFVELHGLLRSGMDIAVEAGWNRMVDAGQASGMATSHLTAALTLTYRMAGSRAL